MRTNRRAALLLVLAVVAPQPRLLGTAAADEAPDCAQLFDRRSFVEAEACFSGVVAQHPADAAALAYLGRTSLERRQVRPAIERLEHAVAREPDRAELHDWLGRAYGIAAERAALVRQAALAIKARKEFERAVALDGANLDAREDLIEFQIRAPAVLGGSLEKARAQAAELERRDPLRGRLARAEILVGKTGSAAADRELQAAAVDVPGDPRPQLALAVAYGNEGLYDKAFKALDAVLRLVPDSAEAHLELGRTAVRSGRRLDRAEELLARDLQLLSAGDTAALADAHYALGAVLERKGDRAQAHQHYQQALRLDPDFPQARRALRRFP
jgi:tetratricopeptide (TPR) repeat protein